MTDAEVGALAQKHADELGEHGEAVLVMISWSENGITKCRKGGTGNWYARAGMAREFLNQDQASGIANEIQKAQPPDDGDDWKAPA